MEKGIVHTSNVFERLELIAQVAVICLEMLAMEPIVLEDWQAIKLNMDTLRDVAQTVEGECLAEIRRMGAS